jgi:hypothetical protein
MSRTATPPKSNVEGNTGSGQQRPVAEQAVLVIDDDRLFRELQAR